MASDPHNDATPVRLVTESTVVWVSGSADERLAAIAAPQKGRAAHRQLRSGGLSNDQIHWRLEKGLLIPEHRGVYALGHADDTPEARAIAGLLTRGPAAQVAGLSAANLEGLHSFDGPVHLLLPGNAGNRGRPGIVIHRTKNMPEPKWVNGLPLTPTEHTIITLAAQLKPRQTERLLDEALTRGLTTRDRIATALQPHHPGATVLGPLLDERLVANPTHSEGQERMLQLIRDAGLPDPVGEADIGGGFTADFYWPEKRVAGEFDSKKWHSSQWARKRDARKDLHCAGNEITMIRALWADLFPPAALALVARFAQALA